MGHRCSFSGSRLLTLVLMGLLGGAQIVLAAERIGVRFDAATDKRFPVTEAVIDVTAPPYGATGMDTSF